MRIRTLFGIMDDSFAWRNKNEKIYILQDKNLYNYFIFFFYPVKVITWIYLSKLIEVDTAFWEFRVLSSLSSPLLCDIGIRLTFSKLRKNIFKDLFDCSAIWYC